MRECAALTVCAPIALTAVRCGRVHDSGGKLTRTGAACLYLFGYWMLHKRTHTRTRSRSRFVSRPSPVAPSSTHTFRMQKSAVFSAEYMRERGRPFDLLRIRFEDGRYNSISTKRKRGQFIKSKKRCQNSVLRFERLENRDQAFQKWNVYCIY